MMTYAMKDDRLPDGTQPMVPGGAHEDVAEATRPDGPLHQPCLEGPAPEERDRAGDAERRSWELWRAACRVWG